MSEENNNLPIEDQARDMGWAPKEEFEGDPDKWVSAETFVARKPLFDKIEQVNRHAKALEKKQKESEATIRALADYNKKIAEQEYKRALTTLKEEKRAALISGDSLAAEDIQEKIDNFKPTLPNVPVPEPTVERPPEVQEWLAQNAWYDANEEAQAVADAAGKRALKDGKSPQEVLVVMRERAAALFPELVGGKPRNKNKDDAAPVFNSTAGVSNASKGASKFRPTAEQKAIAERFVGMNLPGIKTVEDYYKQLAELGD